jgi:hypothetical protein
MSKNSKNSKRLEAAKQISKQRVSGSAGPSKTLPKHGKKNAWWQKFRSYREFAKKLGIKEFVKAGVR